MKYNWPLNDSNFSWMDRLKICKFFLTPSNFWTQNKYVAKFEKEMAEFCGFKYSVFVSSGSTANTILAMYLKDALGKEFRKRKMIVLPSVTWTTSCSPFIREGFTPHFIDINLTDFSIWINQLKEFLSENHEKVAAVFPTALLGFNPDYSEYVKLKNLYPKIKFWFDQCENNFASFEEVRGIKSNLFTSTTSTYMGHEIQSVEGGFLFTNSKEEYSQFLMYRNHGMPRGMDGYFSEEEISKFRNPKVDKRFDFRLLSNNFRNTDINAFIGLLDLRKKYKYIAKRRSLYKIFREKICYGKYLLPNHVSETGAVPFCLPIVCLSDNQANLYRIKEYCRDNRIEYRPIISGYLGYQTAYKGKMKDRDFSNSIYIHKNGIYVGLHHKVTEKQVKSLVEFLNKI